MMKKIFLIAVLIVTFKTGFSQNDFYSGTPYSAFGIGDLRYSASSRTDMMGIQGISLLGNYINSLNPASNTNLQITMVSLNAGASFLNTSNELSTSKISDVNVIGFNFGVPIWQKYGLVASFGLNPLSTIQYKISGSINSQGTSYTETFAGLGGITKLHFGFAGKPLKFLSLGVNYDYNFGNLKTMTFFDFNTQGIQNTYIRSENQLKGSSFKAGAVLSLGDLFQKNKFFEGLNIGFFYQTKFNLSSSFDRIYSTSIDLDTVSFVSPDVEIPESYGFGITKQIGKQLIVSSDIMMQKWSKMKPGALLPANYQDNFRYGIGFEILPAIKKDKNFFESMTYRAGFSYDKSYYKINDEFVNNYAVNLGLGIPVNNENAIDIGFTLGTRGKKDNGFIKDNYLKISFGLNIGEFWFLKPANEDR